MLVTEEEVDWNQLVFSPFAVVRNHGRQMVGQLPLSSMVQALASCSSFVQSPKAVLLLGGTPEQPKT